MIVSKPLGPMVTLLCAVLFLATPARADWMLISNAGTQPNRVAVYVDLASLKDVPDEKGWRTILDAEPGPERDKALQQPITTQTMDVVEVLESPDGPESRFHTLTVHSDDKTCQFQRTREWRADGSYSDLGGTGRQPLTGWTERAFQLATDQRPWKEALIALLERTKREKTVSEQTELAPFGYEWVQSGDAASLSELTRQYVWPGTALVATGTALATAKRQAPASPGTARLQGVAAYFNDTIFEDRGWVTASAGTPIYLHALDPVVMAVLLQQSRVRAIAFSDWLPPETLAARKETQVLNDRGEFAFDGLQPGLYLLECRIPYRYLRSNRVVDEVIEHTIEYEDGTYDVEETEEFYHLEYTWDNAPGNCTIDVVEVLPGGKPTTIRLTNVR